VHFLFSTLKDSCISEMVSTMRMHTYQRNTHILMPSPTMRALFVIERGTVEMKKGDDDDDAATLGVGHVLGDDHFLYANGTSDIMQHYIARSETVILWSLRYDVFRECKRAEFRNSKKVLKQLLLKVARQLGGDADVVPSYMYDDFMPQTFPAGATVIRQGEEGSCCYILASGTVDVFVDSKRVRTLQEGSYFGHRALRSESAVRTATCVARSKIHCFTLDRLTFASLVRRKKERVTAAIERGQRSSHPKAPDLPSYAERVVMPSFPLGKAEIVRTRRDVSEEAKSKACTPIPMLKYSSFRVVRAIGKGAFGKVVLAKYNASRELYAIKRVDTSAAREMRVMSGLCHPNIAHVVAQVKTRMGLFLVLPFFGGGDLFSALDRQKDGRFSPSRVCQIAASLLSAVEHMHANRIIHRDIKLENIMEDYEGQLRVVDFGVSKELESADQRLNTICGTPQYMSYEMLIGSTYTYPVDFWASGVVLFEALTGVSPFWKEADYGNFKQAYVIVGKHVREYQRCWQKYSGSKRMLRYTLKDLMPFAGRNSLPSERKEARVVADLILKLLCPRAHGRIRGKALREHEIFSIAQALPKRKDKKTPSPRDVRLASKNFDDFDATTTKAFFFGDAAE